MSVVQDGPVFSRAAYALVRGVPAATHGVYVVQKGGLGLELGVAVSDLPHDLHVGRAAHPGDVPEHFNLLGRLYDAATTNKANKKLLCN